MCIHEPIRTAGAVYHKLLLNCGANATGEHNPPPLITRTFHNILLCNSFPFLFCSVLSEMNQFCKSTHSLSTLPPPSFFSQQCFSGILALESKLAQFLQPRLVFPRIPHLLLLGKPAHNLDVRLLISRRWVVVFIQVDLAQEQHILAADEEDSSRDVGIQTWARRGRGL
jgi:hypothetical protein